MPEIKMPKLSDTMTEGTVAAWKKKVGDFVVAGDVIADIETDKATMEWESAEDGALIEIYVPEGGHAAVGERIAFIQGKGEDAPQKSDTVAGEEKHPKPESGTYAKIKAVVSSESAVKPDRIKASPLAKKTAAEKGIDLSKITGSGPSERIIQKDVLNAAAAGGGQQLQKPIEQPSQPAHLEKGKRIPFTGMRKTIAARLLESKTTIPHFYLQIEVDAAPLTHFRAEINAASEKAGFGKLTINDFVLKAAILAAVKVPKVNATFDKDGVILHEEVNLAVAVAVEDGLLTPVLRNAQTKSLREISAAVKDFAGRARSKKLAPDEYQGGTMTVSNLGAYGIENFFAIINPPQAVILSVGAIMKKPVVNAQGEVAAGLRMAVGMSCDHRVVDGAIGAEYLAELKRLIEEPALIIL